MLTNDLVLDRADGTDVTYRLTTPGDPNGSRRIDISTTAQAPNVLNIKHSATGRGASAVDRHLIQFQRTVQTPTGPVQLTTNVTVAVPRVSEVTTQMVKDQITNMIDLLTDGSIANLATSANLEAILRNES